LQAFENNNPVSVLQSGLFFLGQLEEAHFSNDIWLFDFDLNTWKELTITPKITACGHATAVLLPDGILVIGGETFPPKIINNVWKLVPSEINSET
jgi:N-acetylneuraminic acid mutarotase